MRRVIMAMAVAVAVAVAWDGAAEADLLNWQIKAGISDNKYPYGSDFSTRLGVAENGTWDYDGNDAAHPPVADPSHDLAFVYSDKYYQVFIDVGIGWPPPWKPDAGIPHYPKPGLLKDTREPILAPGQVEFWLVYVYAPMGPGNPDYDDETCAFRWEYNMEPGFEVPSYLPVFIWGNPDLEAVGIVGNLIFNDYGPGSHVIPDIPQWGLDEDENPIRHEWIIQAGVPEPAMAPVAGLAATFGALGLSGKGQRRKRAN